MERKHELKKNKSSKERSYSHWHRIVLFRRKKGLGTAPSSACPLLRTLNHQELFRSFQDEREALLQFHNFLGVGETEKEF